MGGGGGRGVCGRPWHGTSCGLEVEYKTWVTRFGLSRSKRSKGRVNADGMFAAQLETAGGRTDGSHIHRFGRRCQLNLVFFLFN